MLQIRFNRIGKKNRAIFRIALQEHTIAPGGRHVEILGSWDPRLKKGVFQGEKIKRWIAKGAQVSDSVWNLLVRQGIIEGKKRAIKIGKPAEAKSEEPAQGGSATGGKKEEAPKEEIETKEVKAEEAKPAEEKKPEEKKEEAKPEKTKKT